MYTSQLPKSVMTGEEDSVRSISLATLPFDIHLLIAHFLDISDVNVLLQVSGYIEQSTTINVFSSAARRCTVPCTLARSS